MCDESSGGGNEDVCLLLHGSPFLFVAYAVVASVYGQGGCLGGVV